jgi:hypothetical protein
MACVVYQFKSSPLYKYQANMETLQAEEAVLNDYKEIVFSQIEDINAEIEDLIYDYESATSANLQVLRQRRLQLQSSHMQTICDLARLQVQKEIIRCLTEKGMTEQAALKVAKDSAN